MELRDLYPVSLNSVIVSSKHIHTYTHTYVHTYIHKLTKCTNVNTAYFSFKILVQLTCLMIILVYKAEISNDILFTFYKLHVPCKEGHVCFISTLNTLIVKICVMRLLEYAPIFTFGFELYQFEIISIFQNNYSIHY